MRILLIVAVCLTAYACGGASMPVADAADVALNTVTDTAQPVYDMAQRWCSVQEWAVVDSDRTPSQKEAAVQKIRTRCDEVFALFERVISLQAEIRTVIEASRSGAGDALKALARVREVQALLTEALERFEKIRGQP